MRKKPLKISEKKKLQKQLEEKMARKTRKTEEISPIPPRTIIFCEGTKTEPHYLQEIVNLIKEKCRNYSKQERIKLDQIKIKGTRRSSTSLFSYAVDNTDSDIAMVWLVYDKDDFPADQFDNTPAMAKAQTKNGKAEYHTAWSNECFELWLLLHYIPLESNINREEYHVKLKEPGRLPSYKKNHKDVYTKTKHLLNVAFKNAKTLHNKYEGQALTPSKMAPCTQMDKLVRWLIGYI